MGATKEEKNLAKMEKQAANAAKKAEKQAAKAAKKAEKQAAKAEKVKAEKPAKAPKAPKAPKAAKPAKAKKENKLVKAIKSEGKQSNLQSIKVKIIALVFATTVIAVTIVAAVVINYAKSLVVDSAYGKMLNIVASYGNLVDKEEDKSKVKTKILEPEEYAALVGEVTLDGVNDSTCYMVNKSGVIAYHPNPEKISKPNKNEVIRDVVAGIAKGKVPDNLCLEYEDEDGVLRYASFYITTARNILVMDAPASELMSPINTIMRIAVLITIVIMIIAFFITLVIVNGITNPLKQVTAIINDTAQLKLTTPENLDKLCKRPDETGEISRAVKVMTDSLKDVVSRIDASNKSIEADMSKLEESSNQVNAFCTDNSATAQQLAASTDLMAERIQMVSDKMGDMRNKSHTIDDVTSKSNEISEEIAGRAQNMQATTLAAIENTRNMYKDLKEKTDAAVEGLTSVSKINELTEAISDISDQTSLLSLNASIEAARAGEAGRGFMVVASEISNLSHKSLENAKNINSVVQEVNLAVSNISKAMEETSAFLENNVLADYDGFNEIGDQYLADADVFKSTMTQISNEVVELNRAINEVAENLSEVQNTMTETSVGVTDIAEKTSEVVGATTTNYELTNNTVASVEELKNIVDKFVL